MPVIVPEKTIKFQARGFARLSPDLADMGEYFRYSINKKKRTLALWPTQTDGWKGQHLRLWKAGERARSGNISLQGALRELGIDADMELTGKVYKVRVRGGRIVVQF